MPDRRAALSNVSAALREQVIALQALMEPSDHDLPDAMRLLLDGIDRVDVAASARFDSRPSA
jgi:hypothetical protein